MLQGVSNPLIPHESDLESHRSLYPTPTKSLTEPRKSNHVPAPASTPNTLHSTHPTPLTNSLSAESNISSSRAPGTHPFGPMGTSRQVSDGGGAPQTISPNRAPTFTLAVTRPNGTGATSSNSSSPAPVGMNGFTHQQPHPSTSTTAAGLDFSTMQGFFGPHDPLSMLGGGEKSIENDSSGIGAGTSLDFPAELAELLKNSVSLFELWLRNEPQEIVIFGVDLSL